VTRIIQRDLRNSSRYNMLEAVPQQLRAGRSTTASGTR
jgi:hypothetical protein